jgi:hypothetical protein
LGARQFDCEKHEVRHFVPRPSSFSTRGPRVPQPPPRIPADAGSGTLTSRSEPTPRRKLGRTGQGEPSPKQYKQWSPLGQSQPLSNLPLIDRRFETTPNVRRRYVLEEVTRPVCICALYNPLYYGIAINLLEKVPESNRTWQVALRPMDAQHRHEEHLTQTKFFDYLQVGHNRISAPAANQRILVHPAVTAAGMQSSGSNAELAMRSARIPEPSPSTTFEDAYVRPSARAFCPLCLLEIFVASKVARLVASLGTSSHGDRLTANRATCGPPPRRAHALWGKAGARVTLAHLRRSPRAATACGQQSRGVADSAGRVASQGAELADPQELLRWVHGVQPKSRLDAYPLFIMVRAGTHCTGLVQIAGQVQACSRDSPSKHWAKSRNLGQPCENHLAGAGRRGARTRVTHGNSCIAVHRLQRACAACRQLIAIIVLGAAQVRDLLERVLEKEVGLVTPQLARQEQKMGHMHERHSTVVTNMNEMHEVSLRLVHLTHVLWV